MTCTIEQFRAGCASQDGTTELPVNDVKFNTWYYGHRVNGTQYAWCAVFLSWVWVVACGASAHVLGLGDKGTAGVREFRLAAQRLGKWGTTIKVGAFVCYAEDAHIEFVDEITPSGFWAWAGNTGQASFNNGGGVHRVFRSWKNLPHPIAGYVYPDYAPAPTPPQEDDDMVKLLHPTEGPDAGNQFLWAGDRIALLSGPVAVQLQQHGLLPKATDITTLEWAWFQKHFTISR